MCGIAQIDLAGSIALISQTHFITSRDLANFQDLVLIMPDLNV